MIGEMAKSTPARTQPAAANLPDVFRSLYYYLHSNSSVSRADRLIEDISLLLLCKFVSERDCDR